MKFKKYVSASMAIAFVAAAMASPAYAAGAGEAKTSAAQPSQQVLAGPAGSFSLSSPKGSTVSSPPAQVSSAGVAGRSETVVTSTVSAANPAVSFNVSLPEAARAEVITNEGGETSVVLLTSDGQLLGGIASGAATDATGAAVPTAFAVTGNKITQTVAPDGGSEVIYPVVMAAQAGTIWYSSAWVTTNSKGYIVNAVPTALGRKQIAHTVHTIHAQHVRSILGTQAYRVNFNIEQQLICHVVGAWFATGTYNMESWQPELLWGVIANPWDRCNRIK